MISGWFSIRINGVVAASFHIFAPVGLVLKAGWRKVRQITPKGYIVVAGIMGAIAGYPQLKQGAGELYKDLNSGFHYVIDGHQKTNPEVIKGGECIYNLKPPGDNEA